MGNVRRGMMGMMLAAALSGQPATAQEKVPASEGMTAYRSDADFAATLARVEPAVKAHGLYLMRVLDHAGAAAQFGRELAPNSVVLFGNPQIGSQVMTCAPRAGIDLPQKLLVWKEDGTVMVGYNDPAHLVWRHSIEGCDEILARVAENLDGVAREVAGGG
jgi:uncharacterized protein (DUF302 family)